MERPHLGLGLLFQLRDGPVGRRTLVERTGWTESVVRTELEKLEAQGWVEFAKPGTSLTERAADHLARFFAHVPDVTALDLVDLHLDTANRAALVRGVPHAPRHWRVRDLAVREGSTGILLLSRENGSLKLLDVDASFSRRNARDAARIEEALGTLESGDWIVIVFAPNEAVAATALWRVLLDSVPGPALDRPPDTLSRRTRERA